MGGGCDCSRSATAFAERIEALHAQHGHEPAVREALVRALTNAAVVEPDSAKRRALAERDAPDLPPER
jgi:hypothetical protein